MVYACVIWLTAEPTRHTPLTFDWNQQYWRSLSFFLHSSTENSNARDLYIFRPHLNAICVGGNSQIHPHETNNNEISMQQNWILSHQFWHSIELNRLEICHVCNIVVLIFRPHATQVTLYNQMPSLASFFYIFFCIFVVFRLLKSWVEPLNTGSDQNQSLFILIESLEIPLCLETCMMLFYGIQAIPQGWSMWLHPIFSASNVMQVVFLFLFFFVSSSINFQASSIAIFDENWAAEDANERETWCRMLIFFTLTASKDVQFRLNNGIDDLNQQHRCVASINKTEKSFGAITMHRTPFDWQSNAFLVLVINFSGW